MHKIAIVVLADTESHGDLGRVVNAMEVAKEFLEAGDRVALLFDGAGTKWVGTVNDPSHKRHALWNEVAPAVVGACSFCSTAFGAEEGVRAAGVALLDDFDDHPSLRSYVLDGYTVLTF